MRILSGVQPSGKLHIGNWFGAIRQFVELQDKGDALFFIADLHAMTSVREPRVLGTMSRDVALDYLALGIDPKRAVLFRQSDVPEVTELHWILSTLTPMGLLERGHAYKDKIAKGLAPDLGIFAYPVLMAVDILLYGSDVVPVGKDQLQHLEMTRDIAIKFNATYVPGFDPADPEAKNNKRAKAGILKMPEPLVQEATALVPGTDGERVASGGRGAFRKMSKSWRNTIDLFSDDGIVKKQIMGIKTDSTPVEAAKDPDATPILALLRLFATPEEMAEHERTFREGGKGYGHYKMRLLELFHETFDEARKRRKELEKDPGFVDAVLREGAEKARAYAKPTIDAVRDVVGIRPR